MAEEELPVSDEDLNHLVNGLLPPERAAQISAAIAADPVLQVGAPVQDGNNDTAPCNVAGRASPHLGRVDVLHAPGGLLQK